MNEVGGATEGRVTGPPSRYPHVLLTTAEVEQAVREVSQWSEFVIDIETTKQRAQDNRLLWVGLGVDGQNYLIPCGHPHGIIKEREHTEKVSVHKLYPVGHPKTLTPGGKLRNAHENKKLATTYHPPPKQLYADELCELLRPLLFSDRSKIGHNVKFDLLSLVKYYGEIPPPPYHDTIIIRHVLNEEINTGYGLKELVYSWFKIPVAERNKRYPDLVALGGDLGIQKFGLDEVAYYVAKDLRYCWMMYKKWYPLLKAKGMQGVYDFEMKLYPVLMDIENRGFPVDLSRMGEVEKELEEALADISSQCYQLADNGHGGEFSMSDLDAKRWVLFGEGTAAFPTDPKTGRTDRSTPLKSQNLKVISRTPGRDLPQVTQAVLENYRDRGNKMAELFLQWSEYEKLRGTFVVGITNLLHHNSEGLPTIHTSFKQHGTKTGRLSSTKPNLQQLPKGTRIRDLFVAGDEDHVLIVADYDQIELRCAGFLSKDREMARIFKAGEDIHKQAAAAMYSVPLLAVTEAQRDVGKTQNFAVLYGARETKIASVAKCSKRRASQLIARYYETFRDLEPWKLKVLRTAMASGDVANASDPPHVVIPPIGRLRRLPDLYRLTQEDRGLKLRAERQAINAVVQGFASNIAKLAMITLHTRLQAYPAEMLVQVHDEIVFRVEKKYLDTVLPVVTETMTGVVNVDGSPILGSIPLIVSAKAGYTWASAKGK